MKKLITLLLTLSLVVGCVCSLASCSNVSQSYANKINKAAERGEPLTKTEVLEDLGEDAFELDLVFGGVIMAVKDCDSWEDVKEKLDEGKTVKGIVVTIGLGKATGAEYREITDEDGN